MAFNQRGGSGSPAVANCQEILGNVTSQCGLVRVPFSSRLKCNRISSCHVFSQGGYRHPSVTGYTFTVDLNSGHCGEVTGGEVQIEE